MTQFTFDENVVSDLYKDAYGFRPRGAFWDMWNQMSNDEKQAEWDSLLNALELEMQREADAKIAAEQRWNENIRTVVEETGASEEAALRWLWDAEDISEPNSQDIESFVWQHDLLFTDTGKAIVRRLTEILKPEY